MISEVGRFDARQLFPKISPLKSALGADADHLLFQATLAMPAQLKDVVHY